MKNNVSLNTVDCGKKKDLELEKMGKNVRFSPSPAFAVCGVAERRIQLVRATAKLQNFMVQLLFLR